MHVALGGVKLNLRFVQKNSAHEACWSLRVVDHAFEAGLDCDATVKVDNEALDRVLRCRVFERKLCDRVWHLAHLVDHFDDVGNRQVGRLRVYDFIAKKVDSDQLERHTCLQFCVVRAITVEVEVHFALVEVLKVEVEYPRVCIAHFDGVALSQVTPALAACRGEKCGAFGDDFFVDQEALLLRAHQYLDDLGEVGPERLSVSAVKCSILMLGSLRSPLAHCGLPFVCHGCVCLVRCLWLRWNVGVSKKSRKGMETLL